MAMTASQLAVASDLGVVDVQATIGRKKAELVAARAARAAVIAKAGLLVANGKPSLEKELIEARNTIANLEDVLVGLDQQLHDAHERAAVAYTATKRAEIEMLIADAADWDRRFDAIVRNEIPVIVPADAPPLLREPYAWKQHMLDESKAKAASLRGHAQYIQNGIAQLNGQSRFRNDDPDPH